MEDLLVLLLTSSTIFKEVRPAPESRPSSRHGSGSGGLQTGWPALQWCAPPGARPKTLWALKTGLCFLRVCFMSCSLFPSYFRSGTLFLATCPNFGVHLNRLNRNSPYQAGLDPSTSPSSTRAIVLLLTNAVNHPLPSVGRRRVLILVGEFRQTLAPDGPTPGDVRSNRGPIRFNKHKLLHRPACRSMWGAYGSKSVSSHWSDPTRTIRSSPTTPQPAYARKP